MRWNWLRVYCNFCGPSMSSPRAFGKCFTQARVSWAAEMGADDPLWHSPSISPQELGHRRWRVQSQSFCSSVFMATINHSLVLLCSRGNLCVRHREALVDKPFPSSSTSNFIIQHCTGLFLPFYTRKKKKKHECISEYSPLINTLPFFVIGLYWFHQKRYECILLFAILWWNQRFTSPPAL